MTRISTTAAVNLLRNLLRRESNFPLEEEEEKKDKKKRRQKTKKETLYSLDDILKD